MHCSVLAGTPRPHLGKVLPYLHLLGSLPGSCSREQPGPIPLRARPPAGAGKCQGRVLSPGQGSTDSCPGGSDGEASRLPRHRSHLFLCVPSPEGFVSCQFRESPSELTCAEPQSPASVPKSCQCPQVPPVSPGPATLVPRVRASRRKGFSVVSPAAPSFHLMSLVPPHHLPGKPPSRIILSLLSAGSALLCSARLLPSKAVSCPRALPSPCSAFGDQSAGNAREYPGHRGTAELFNPPGPGNKFWARPLPLQNPLDEPPPPLLRGAPGLAGVISS